MQTSRSPSRSTAAPTSVSSTGISDLQSKSVKPPDSFPVSIPELGTLPAPQSQPLFSPTGLTSLLGSSSVPVSANQGAGALSTAVPSEQFHQSPPPDNRAAEENSARLCRIGQGIVHEIVQKMVDLFQVTRSNQLPSHSHSSVQMQLYNDRQKHIQDAMRMITTYFRQLKQVYVNVTENCSRMNLRPVQDLIPLEDDELSPSNGEQSDTYKHVSAELESDSYKQVAAEHAALTETLRARNAHIKEIVDQLRSLLWEINTMMSMKSSKG